MEFNEKEFSAMKYVGYLVAGIVDLVLAGACIKSNMRPITKLGLTVICIEQSEKLIVESLKQIKVNNTNLKVVK